MSDALKARIQQKRFRNPAHEAILSLMVAAAHVRQMVEQACADHDLTQAQYNVLRILRGKHPDGYPRGEMASRMIDRAPDVTRLIDRLERRGLVERARSTEDRRLSITRITRKGLAVLAQARSPHRRDRSTALVGADPARPEDPVASLRTRVRPRHSHRGGRTSRVNGTPGARARSRIPGVSNAPTAYAEPRSADFGRRPRHRAPRRRAAAGARREARRAVRARADSRGRAPRPVGREPDRHRSGAAAGVPLDDPPPVRPARRERTTVASCCATRTPDCVPRGRSGSSSTSGIPTCACSTGVLPRGCVRMAVSATPRSRRWP